MLILAARRPPMGKIEPLAPSKRVRIVLANSDPDDACVKRSVAAVLSPHAH